MEEETGPRTAGAEAIEIEVALAPSFGGEAALLEARRTTLALPLTAGAHISTSLPEVVGQVPGFANPDLMASISISYSYDPAMNMITFYSNDLVSPDAPYVTSWPRGSKRQWRLHSYSDPRARGGSVPDWSAAAAPPPGLADALRATVRAANHEAIEAAKARGMIVLVRAPVPPLTPEQEAGLRLVYRDGVFDRPYEPGEPLGAGEVVNSIMSVFGGTITFPLNTTFANVRGSTTDPKPPGTTSWIGFWQAYTGLAAPQCTSLGYGGPNIPAGYPCTAVTPGRSPLGGHVVFGTAWASPPYGSNHIVFIVPICSKHNSDYSVYMEALQVLEGVWLDNYHQ